MLDVDATVTSLASGDHWHCSCRRSMSHSSRYALGVAVLVQTATRGGGEHPCQRHVGKWAANPSRVPSSLVPDGPLLANGDLGAVMSGATRTRGARSGHRGSINRGKGDGSGSDSRFGGAGDWHVNSSATGTINNNASHAPRDNNNNGAPGGDSVSMTFYLGKMDFWTQQTTGNFGVGSLFWSHVAAGSATLLFTPTASLAAGTTNKSNVLSRPSSLSDLPLREDTSVQRDTSCSWPPASGYFCASGYCAGDGTHPPDGSCGPDWLAILELGGSTTQHRVSLATQWCDANSSCAGFALDFTNPDTIFFRSRNLTRAATPNPSWTVFWKVRSASCIFFSFDSCTTVCLARSSSLWSAFL